MQSVRIYDAEDHSQYPEEIQQKMKLRRARMAKGVREASLN